MKQSKRLNKTTRRMQRELSRAKKTGEISPWLARKCMNNERLCRKVMPGLVPVVHTESLEQLTSRLMRRYMQGTISTLLKRPGAFVRIKNIGVPTP